MGSTKCNKEVHKNAEQTFAGAINSSIIDYVVCNVKTCEKEIKSVRIKERTELDLPLEAELEAKKTSKMQRETIEFEN